MYTEKIHFQHIRSTMEQNEDGIKRATTDKQDLHETVTSLPQTQKYEQPNPLQLTFFNRYFF